MRDVRGEKSMLELGTWNDAEKSHHIVSRRHVVLAAARRAASESFSQSVNLTILNNHQ